MKSEIILSLIAMVISAASLIITGCSAILFNEIGWTIGTFTFAGLILILVIFVFLVSRKLNKEVNK